MTEILAATDALGLHAHYYRVDGAGTADSIEALLKSAPLPAPTLDRQGVHECFQGERSGRRTCFEAVRPVPAGCHLIQLDGGFGVLRSPQPNGPSQSPDAALSSAAERILTDSRPKALALSGGLDSALVLALVRRAGGRGIPIYTLASAMPGYCELEQTRETCHAMGVDDLRVVSVCESDFVEALPGAVNVAETPLYNLHPVSKLLLARALKRDGIDVVITGDGADQVFGTSDGRDYLPIVGALFRAAGIELRTPFGDECVIAAAQSAGRDPGKSALRAVARGRLPETCFKRPKRPCYAPAMDLCQYERPDLTARLADEVSLEPPTPTNDRERTLWITLGLLVRHFRGERQ